MSVADKLQAIAENEKKVFDAGKIALLKASNYMNAAASGKVITVGDVSPVEHDVAVTLSSGSVTDFSSVTVKRYGKNLLDNNTDTVSSISYTGSSGNIVSKYYGYAVPLSAGTYTIHAEGDLADDYVYGVLNTVSGEYMQNVQTVIGAILRTVTFTANEDCILYIYNAGTGNINIGETKGILAKYNIQLEIGSSSTPFEPYVEPTIHVANADGTVEGVKSLSPSMTLVTDTDGVTLDCSYLRDIDTYIDSLIGGE